MRMPLIVAAAAATLLAVLPAAAGHAAPGHDQATGTGTLAQFGDPTAHVNAVATRPGLAGGFTISYPDGTFATGRATCLAASGATAYVTGRITDSGGPRQEANRWAPGNYLVIGVADHGSPGTAGPDLLNFSPGFAADPGCGPNPQADPVFAIVDGNYRVVDAS